MAETGNGFPAFHHDKAEANRFFHGDCFWHGGWRWHNGCGEKFGPKSKNHDRELKGRMVKNGSRRMAVAAM